MRDEKLAGYLGILPSAVGIYVRPRSRAIEIIQGLLCEDPTIVGHRHHIDVASAQVQDAQGEAFSVFPNTKRVVANRGNDVVDSDGVAKTNPGLSWFTNLNVVTWQGRI